MNLEPGYQVYSSCRAEIAGEILRVGTDANGEPIVDLFVHDINEFLGGRWESQKEGYSGSDLMHAATLEDYRAAKYGMVPAVLTDLQYEDSGDGYITLNTPGTGCHRCSSFFSIVKPGSEYHQPNYLP